MDELVLDPDFSGILKISDVEYILAVTDSADLASSSSVTHEKSFLV